MEIDPCHAPPLPAHAEPSHTLRRRAAVARHHRTARRTWSTTTCHALAPARRQTSGSAMTCVAVQARKGRARGLSGPRLVAFEVSI